ncbi:DNA mismatch repair protein Mlh3 isoform X1 [Carassius gibelio]|uniref:DNA mismatch repair protein Mlh3 isoform X1 n=1 Tax=Carassius gibelio TaxID=101364 RepID=UPI002278B4A3|nr:DNA mismatch repair protein Mlh3 isoform X1 [Carassius gibelio]XP_052449580.1 DNA mismatch repair protein Mlh3 isoform X1 [Carassius gibelio]
MIKSLPKDVQAQLRSGVTIFSLQQCVEELILNSIDAGATCVAVKIDIEACKLQVIDNGTGMCQEDMERVGLRYNTSKCSSLEDLENLRFYGFRGEAISSIVSLAEMVEISSRTKLSVKTYVKTFNETNALDVVEAQAIRPSTGTTVSVYNLFHNMPVRRKRMDTVLETERIRQRVESISLMHPSVSFTVKKENSAHMMVQLSKTSSTYYRFVQIHGLSRAQKLGEVNYVHKQFEMTGHIGREGHYNNSLQFLFVNGRLLLKTRIHKTLNCLLKRVSSAARQNNSPTAYPITSSPKQRGGCDLHGVYMLNIKCHYSEYDICLEPAKSLIEFKDWDNVLICIEEGVKAFLTKENLVTEFSMNGSDGPSSSPVRNAKTPVAIQNLSVDETREEFDALSEKKDNASTADVSGGVQMLEKVSTNTETVSSEESEAEKVLQAELSLRPTFADATEINNTCKKDESAVCPNISHYDLPVNNMTGSKNQKISIIDGKDAEDTLKKFCFPNTISPKKRKLALNDTEEDKHGFYGTNSKTSRAVPCRKLALSFETGSLDKFKRLFGKGAEKKQRSTEKTNLLNSASSRKSNVCFEGTTWRLEDLAKPLLRNTSGAHFLYSSECSAESSSWNKPDKLSLAAKCSYLKQDKRPSSKISRSTDFLTTGNSSFPFVEDSNFQEGSRELEKSLLEDVLFGSTGTVDSVVHETPIFTLNEPETNSPILEDSHFSNKNVTSFVGSVNCVDEAIVTSQHDPQCSNTGNEGQTTNQCVETIPMSSSWLAHYDSWLGRLVYINQVTGLSKYNSPPVEESQVPCTTDVTNMAVSVISRTGFEYRCYPFHTDIVLPFLPKPRAERALNSEIDSREDAQGPDSLSTLFSEWSNPVFIRPPEVAVDVTSGQAEGLAVKIHNILYPYRFTKNMIHTMRVINQVDKKFLACLINTTEQEVPESSTNEGNLLVLVDQHAAHERVRLEGLVTDSYEDDPDTPGKKKLCSSSVIPPLEINVTEEELRLLRSCQAFLRGLALDVSFPKSESLNVFLERLPTCFIEKESTELRRGRRSVIKTIAEDYLREHIELLRSTGRVRGMLPLTVHNVLASQACHGAIKFNDILSKEECCSLVSSLSSCQLPFQCAHGRPSIVPLADLHHLEEPQDLPKPNLRKLRRMYKSWLLYGKDQSVAQSKT